MAYSYPIWVQVEACIYKSNKSYGAKNTNSEEVFVGTSAKYSHFFCKRAVTRKEFKEYRGFEKVIVFRNYNNGIVLKEVVISKKTRDILEERHAEIKGL